MRVAAAASLLCIVLFPAFLPAQLGFPQVEEVYGGRIHWIQARSVDASTTGLFISTESANSLFYGEVDHSGSTPVFGSFHTVADVDSNDGFGKDISRFSADGDSRWVFFLYQGQLLGASAATPGTIATLDSEGVIAVESYQGYLFYLKQEMGGVEMHHGTIDPATGAFSESSDSPLAFLPAPPASPSPMSIQVGPANDFIYIFEPGSPPGLHRSTETYDAMSGATTFSALDVTDLGTAHEYLAFGIGPDGRLFTGTVAGVEPNHSKFIGYSDDDGASWDTLSTGVTGTSGQNIRCAGADTAYSVLFGTAVSNQRGEDGTWSTIGWNGFETHPNDGAIAADPNNPDVVFMTTDQGIGASLDRGDSIFEINDGVEAVQVNDFDMDGTKTIAWMASKSGVRQVTGYATGSESWSIHFPNGDGSPYHSAAMDQTDASGNTAYAGNVRIYRTDNGGGSWTQVLDVQDPSYSFNFWSYISAIRVHPSDGAVIFGGVNSPTSGVKGGIFYSTDEGDSWTLLETSPYNTEVKDFLVFEEGDGTSTIYVACEYVSDGTTSSYGVKTISYDPSDESFTYSNDMLGETGTQITNFGAAGLAANSAGDLFAGGRRGSEQAPRVYVLRDDSSYWELLPTATLPEAGEVTAITVGEDPSGNEVPYVAVNSGIYYLDGTTWTLGYQYPTGMEVNVLFWDDLLVGTGTGLYGHFFDPSSGVDSGQLPQQVERFSLHQNYPNPFNPTTTIRYTIPRRSLVALTIYDVAGQTVAELVNGIQPANTYRIEWGDSGLPSGIYFYRLKATALDGVQTHYEQTRKMIFIR